MPATKIHAAVDKVELHQVRLTKNTVRFEADEDSFSDISTLYVNKSAFKDYYEANKEFPQTVEVTVEFTG